MNDTSLKPSLRSSCCICMAYCMRLSRIEGQLPFNGRGSECECSKTLDSQFVYTLYINDVYSGGVMVVTLNSWGNSIGCRLPKYVIEHSGLRAGDSVYIRLNDAGDIVIRPVKMHADPAGITLDDSPTKFKSGMPTVEEQW